MKLLTLLMASGVLATLLFSACNKKDDATAQTTLQKLQYKWTFDKEYDNSFYGGLNHRDTTLGVAGDYFDFRTDNKMYVKVGAFPDTLSYSLIGDTKIVFTSGGFHDTAVIQVLNATNLQFYGYSGTPSSYDEYTDYLHK